MTFKIFTIGWEPWLANNLLEPVTQKTGIQFVHGLVGDASRIDYAKQRYPNLNLVSLSKKHDEPLPAPDLELLAHLESVGVSTVKALIQGDRVLRHRTEEETLGYTTLLARNIKTALEAHRPDVVLGAYDSLHAGVGLSVAKSLDIPWVGLLFSTIPGSLIAFGNALTPNSLVPLTREIDKDLRNLARTLIQNVREKKQKVTDFQPPWSLKQWLRQYATNTRNFFRRKSEGILGIDRFRFPTNIERIRDIVRRTCNRLRLPEKKMLREPPKERFAFYPLHMAPESSIDTWAPFYQNQLAFVAQLLLALPADMTLVVKLHFADPDNYDRKQLEQLMSMVQLRIAHPMAASAGFIEKADLVVGITGTANLEAALHGKPVLIFGDSPYVQFPNSERARTPDELNQQIKHMLKLPSPTDEAITESFAAYMARFMPGCSNNWTLPITDDDYERVSACFNTLRYHLGNPVNRDNWYKQNPFVTNQKNES